MILGIIPARGGSKGVPRKNIKDLAGRPLLAWTILAAQKSRLLDRFLVSTEDPEIAAVARSYGAEVLDRPPELATDEASSREVIRHALLATGAQVSVLLQPTSPVRDDDLIDRAIQAFQFGAYDSLATGYMNPLYPPHGQEHRRQDISERFVNDGSIIVSSRQTILDGSLFGRNPGVLVTDKEQNIDIDDQFDFEFARFVLKRRLGISQGNRQEDRHLLASHLLEALEAELGLETAGRVARRAFQGYLTEVKVALPEGELAKLPLFIVDFPRPHGANRH